MRSVIRKPPTMLIVAGGDRDEAEDRAHRRLVGAGFDECADDEMPEIALVADKSGVCRSGGTLVTI